MESYPSGQQSIYFKFSANKVNMVRFWALRKVIAVQPRNLWAFLNYMLSDCLWWVSQSQKCVSSRIIQTYKNWAGSFGAAEQTTQGSGCLCKCYRLVDVIQHVHFLSLTGILRTSFWTSFCRCLWTTKHGLYESIGHLGAQNTFQRIWWLYSSCWTQVRFFFLVWSPRFKNK